MDEAQVSKYADIKQDGSILLGEHTVCDGANYGRQIGVFTHIHRDHTDLLGKAMQECSQIYVSKPTLEMLSALEQDYTDHVSAECYFKGRHIRALDYESSKRPRIDEFSPKSDYADKITLYQSHHILGSAQVLVKTADGTEIAYTGDFGIDAKPIPCDILVLDSTHGNPMFDAPVDQPSLERRLKECVDEEIQNGKNILIRAHRGRLQYTMHLLHKFLPDRVKFLAHPNDIRLVQVYKKYGMDIRDCIDYTSGYGQDIRESGSLYVEFRTHGYGRGIFDAKKTAVFNLGGWFLGGGTTIRSNGEYNLEFMDHANYATILEYVRSAGPQWVVTDYVRGRQGLGLAEAIRNMGIRAIARPME